MPERICVICGKKFYAKSSRRSFCYEDHYHPCPICGQPVLTKDTYHLNECCCSDHSRQLATQTIHERYEEWPGVSEAATKKRKQTCIERYGTDNPAKNANIKIRISEGLLNTFYKEGKLDSIRAKAQQTYFERTGYYSPNQNPDVIKQTKEKNKQKYGVPDTFKVPEFKAKADATNLDRWGTTKPMQNHEVWKKQRSKRSSYQGIDGTPLDSTYEVAVYNYCLRNNIPIQRTYPITYEYEGAEHKTFIDFVIDGLLVEVKGEHALEGFYDWQPGNTPIARKLEIYKQHHVILITGSSKSFMFQNSVGLKYLDKNQQPLIGVDIELFRHPEFPYAENRPRCFYDVSVNGSPSTFDAFNNELIRWKMIKNRINYMGGFISSKEILTALNVTRTAKQPSWFARSYAEYLLKKYSVSDVIVDPFAGWGTRHDAAKLLHKQYIGCDLNDDLVEWHHSKGRSIQVCDAIDFQYDGKCDVFICPPYQDTEIYFGGQNCQFTQCQWLEIVMNNVPNASRYIMVCKTVDKGYEQYIAETKENRSHLGTNMEYVLVIDNEKIIN